MQIDIWSDVVCPWCYLGKRRFERAVAQLSWGGEIEVRWHAYLLDPTATAEPKDLRAALEKKYGPGAFDGMTKRLTALGAPEGIDYRFDQVVRVSTLDAHRLLAWAWESGGAAAQGPLEERLFEAYFTAGANIADHGLLRDLAVETGLDGAAAAVVLADPTAQRDHVLADLQAAMDHEVTGVPAFLVGGRLMIPGAQEVETFVRVLERARERFDDGS